MQNRGEMETKISKKIFFSKFLFVYLAVKKKKKKKTNTKIDDIFQQTETESDWLDSLQCLEFLTFAGIIIIVIVYHTSSEEQTTIFILFS